MLRLLLAALVSALAFAAPAQACRAHIPQSQRIERLYAYAGFAGILVVRVDSARYTAPAQRDYHPWQAESTIERSLDGARPAGAIAFGRSGSLSGCDDLTPVPSPGDKWVLYLWKTPSGEVLVHQSYPLAVAMKIDPKLPAKLR